MHCYVLHIMLQYTKHDVQFVSIFIHIFLVGSEKLFHFCKSDVSAVQGRPRSLILVPIESVYATSIIVHLSCTVSEILQVFCAADPTPIPP